MNTDTSIPKGAINKSDILSFPGSAWECILRGSASVFGYLQA